MRSKVAALIAATALAVAGSVAPAQAADVTYVTGPGGPFTGYTLPFAVIAPGDTMTYMNLDAFPHDVIALHKGPDTQWCLEGDLKDKFKGQGFSGCPLFWTPLIGVAAETPVLGLENVAPGESYGFFCSIHANMVGTLVVLPSL